MALVAKATKKQPGKAAIGGAPLLCPELPRSLTPPCEVMAPLLRGFITEADLPQAEQLWPGLQKYLRGIPEHERPATFLELIWRFECDRAANAA